MAKGISYGPATGISDSVLKSLENRLLALEAKKKVATQEKMDEVIKDDSEHLEVYNKGNRFVRAWKVLVGKP